MKNFSTWMHTHRNGYNRALAIQHRKTRARPQATPTISKAYPQTRESARRLHQITNGSLRAENGLAV